MNKEGCGLARKGHGSAVNLLFSVCQQQRARSSFDCQPDAQVRSQEGGPGMCVGSGGQRGVASPGFS